MNKKTKKTILISTSIFALCASLFAAFGSNFDMNNIMRARGSSSTIFDGVISFLGANTTRSSYTYTTVSTTAGGNYIKCVGLENGLNENGVVAYLQYSDSEIVFRNSDNSTFNFSGSILKTLTMKKGVWGSFAVKYAYKHTGDESYTFSSELDMTSAKTYSFDLSSLEDISEFKIVRSGSNSGKIVDLSITYDCGPGVSRTLTDVEITNAPTKTVYDDGDSFDPTGMVVTATYSNGDTENVVSSCVFDKTTLAYTDTYVRASYTFKGVTMYDDQSITVNAIAVTGVSLDSSEETINVGKTVTLLATVAPSNATNKNVSWSSDDTSVATVNNGVVTGVAQGTATITVTTEDGNFTDSCEITVEAGSVLSGTYRGDPTSTSYVIFDFDELYYRYVSTNQFTPKDLRYYILISSYEILDDGKISIVVELDTSKSSYNSNFSSYNIFDGNDNLRNNTFVLSANKTTLTADRYYSSSSSGNSKSGTLSFTKQ